MSSKGNAAVDKKTELTFKTIESLKASSAVLQEFTKAAANYIKANQKLIEEGRRFADALSRVAALQTSDVGQGIARLADMHREIEARREVVCRSLQDDLINSIQKTIKPEEAEVAQFEAEYKKVRAQVRADISKLEMASKKAGKKGTGALQESIFQLDAKIKEADQIKADKLRTVLLIERKKYCNFLSQWLPVINALIDMHSEGMRFKEQQQFFSSLAASTQQLPADVEQLITAKTERTFVQIQSSESVGYSDSYYDSGSYSYDYSQTSYDQSYDQSYSQGYGSVGLGTVTALYDFAGQQADDLSFYAGDVITLIADDDGSGWMTGELNGVRGIFPSSYVQKN